MDVPLWELIALAVSLVVAFLFTVTSSSLASFSEARTRQLVEESESPGHPVILWLDRRERVLLTLLFGNTLATIASGALAAGLATAAGLPHPLVFAIGLMTAVVLILCQALPRSIARRGGERLALALLPAAIFAYYLLLPVTFTLETLSRGVGRVLGIKPSPPGPAVTGAEIEYLIEIGSQQGVLDDIKKQLLSSVLEFADLLVKEIMVPRTRIVGIEKNATFEDAMRVVRESEHSRIPVYAESLDDVVGMLYVKDLARDLDNGMAAKEFKLERYCRAPFFVPELMKISRLLREFQKRKTHLAVVVDELGGTSGVVSLEDVLEEIVGEIQDEYDVEEKSIKALAGGGYLADGAAPLRDVEEALDVEFPEEGDYETLGGFLSAIAGRVPGQGTVIVWGGLTFTVRAADARRLLKVEILRARETADGSDTPHPSGQDPHKHFN